MAVHAASTATLRDRVRGRASLPIRERLGAPFANRAESTTSSGLGLKSAILGALSSGKLNLSSRGLVSVPLGEYLAQASSGAESENINFWQVTDLTSLDISHNQITAVDDNAIAALASLTTLTISHNPLGYLPAGLAHLNALKCLRSGGISLGHFQAQNLPNSLVEIDLSGNLLRELCQDFSACLPQLRILCVRKNHLVALPPLPSHLIRLDAAENQLQYGSEYLVSLCELQALDLSSNRISGLPASLESLRSLEVLNLRENLITAIPKLPTGERLHTIMLGSNRVSQCDELVAAKALSVLDISCNGMKRLPDVLCALGQLKTLDARNNNISSLPAGLGYIASLTRVLLDGNPLRSIRRSAWSQGTEELKKFLRTRGDPHPGLENTHCFRDASVDDAVASVNGEVRTGAAAGTINLESTNLRRMPDSLHVALRAGNVNCLKLKNNKLGVEQLALGVRSAISAPQGSLTLQILDISSNLLSDLPGELGYCKSLRVLRLLDNQLTSHALDASWLVGLAGSLEEIDVSRNSFQKIPASIFQLRRLRSFSAAFNQIQNIPGAGWEGLASSLEELNLANNKISLLPDAVCAGLRCLSSLNVENNNLKRIPETLALNLRLKTLRLWGNPQRAVRPAVLEKGTEAILAQLSKRLPDHMQAAVFDAAAARGGH